MTDLDGLMRKHTNALVEARAVQIEAFILAQLRVADLNPADVVLVERRLSDRFEYSLEIKP